MTGQKKPVENTVKSITVFGLGYVGLPLSLLYCIKGYKVYGIDVSENLVRELESGRTHCVERYRGKPALQILKEYLASGFFIPSVDASEALASCDKFIVTVGMPVNSGIPDPGPLQSVCSTLSQGLKRGDTVVIRSTVIPGTVEEKLVPQLEMSGLKAGKDFHLSYCPERISEGRAFEEFESIPVIISGINKESIENGAGILKIISNTDPIPVSSIRTAETAKIFENIQRDVNIAIAHQMADFCQKADIGIFELIKAVNTHPRVNILKPGPGVGGSCIPNAYYYLKAKAVEIGSDTCLFDLSRKINDTIPGKISGFIKEHIEASGRKPSDIKIAVLGIAMKDYCSDDRQSPVIRIINDLIKWGACVLAYDPCVPTKYPFKTPYPEQCIKSSDYLFIGALQEGMDYNDYGLFKSWMNSSPVIFDTKNVIDKSMAQKYGFEVLSIYGGLNTSS